MPELVRGDRLTTGARLEVLRCFVHRWTFENPVGVKQRAKVAEHFKERGLDREPVPLVHDDEWLRGHYFWVRKDGRLADRPAYCVPATLMKDSKDDV